MTPGASFVRIAWAVVDLQLLTGAPGHPPTTAFSTRVAVW